MRIAAAVIGGVGAALCSLRGVFWAGGWLFVSVMMEGGTNAVSLLQVGSEVATAIFGMLGLVGAGLVVAGTRTGAGASLMLIGAVGVVVTVAVYPLLLSILMTPIENAAGASVGPNVYPGAGHYIRWLAPALALLVGAALAFVARRRSGS